MTVVNLSKKLEVLRSVDSGKSRSEIASEFGIDVQTITTIIGQRAKLETTRFKKKSRISLTLADKMRVAHFLNKDHSISQTAEKFGLSKRTVRRIRDNQSNYLAVEASGAHINSHRPLKARYPVIDQGVFEFAAFLRDQRIPVSLGLLQTRARMIAEKHNISAFRASRGWISRFLRRTGVQLSLKLHGKGGSSLPEGHSTRMSEIREISREYRLSNIYNEDESGLFYRMGPNRSYLMPHESRVDARGTSMQKAKSRISTIFCTNADASHVLPMRYIGSSKDPVCFRNHASARSYYYSQRKGWMDGTVFQVWLKWWYSEVKKRSDGPWLLILDNFEGHNETIDLPGVRVECLPPTCTAVYQPLDLGLISQAKMRYRALLLRSTVDILLSRQDSTSGFPDSSRRGLYGLREGQLAHVADAISLMNASWSRVSKCCIMKCWIKSTCLAGEHDHVLRQHIQREHGTLIDLTSSTDDQQPLLSTNDAPLAQAVDETEAATLHDACVTASLLNLQNTPLTQFLLDMIESTTQGMLHSMLNSPVLDEDAPLQYTTPANEIQEFYDSPNHIETDSQDIEALTESQYSDLQRLITSLEHASEEALRITSNPSLSERIDAAVGFAKLFALD